MGDFIPVTVGTDAVLILNANPRRLGWLVEMGTTGVHAGNVGRVHVKKSSPPSNTVGEPNSGQPLTAGVQTGESLFFSEDKTVYKGQIWARASVAAQVVYVKEDIEGENEV